MATTSAQSTIAADAAFSQADINRDGRVDLGEFRQFLGQNIGTAGATTYESAGYDASYASGGYGYGAGAGGYGYGAGAGAYDAAYAGGVGSYGYDAGVASYGYGADAALVAGGAAYESAASTTQVQQYATDAQGLFQDSNPQIIRRPAPQGVQTYTQNIRVRFLQPPPVPPPGPLIIREVRPPQPPPPPPLRIRQQAPPLPQPPPLILRERPPQPPAAVASQTVIRRLAAIPVPPRSVIIERLPPLPPRPRDIVIERWVPYGPQPRRRTLVQRAGAAVQYARPRNIIIQYEQAPVRIVRQFQRLGVVQYNPATYVQQYGAQLLDAATLVQQARSAGVVEDISPPVGYSAATYGQEVSYGGAAGWEGGVGGGYSSSYYESSGGYGGAGWSGAADAAFAAADTNWNGTLDQGEFSNWIGGGVGGVGGVGSVGGVGGSSSSYESYSSEVAY
jgi:hypothetical protein